MAFSSATGWPHCSPYCHDWSFRLDLNAFSVSSTRKHNKVLIDLPRLFHVPIVLVVSRGKNTLENGPTRSQFILHILPPLMQTDCCYPWSIYDTVPSFTEPQTPQHDRARLYITCHLTILPINSLDLYLFFSKGVTPRKTNAVLSFGIAPSKSMPAFRWDLCYKRFKINFIMYHIVCASCFVMYKSIKESTVWVELSKYCLLMCSVTWWRFSR